MIIPITWHNLLWKPLQQTSQKSQMSPRNVGRLVTKSNNKKEKISSGHKGFGLLNCNEQKHWVMKQNISALNCKLNVIVCPLCVFFFVYVKSEGGFIFMQWVTYFLWRGIVNDHYLIKFHLCVSYVGSLFIRLPNGHTHWFGIKVIFLLNHQTESLQSLADYLDASRPVPSICYTSPLYVLIFPWTSKVLLFSWQLHFQDPLSSIYYPSSVNVQSASNHLTWALPLMYSFLISILVTADENHKVFCSAAWHFISATISKPSQQLSQPSCKPSLELLFDHSSNGTLHLHSSGTSVCLLSLIFFIHQILQNTLSIFSRHSPHSLVHFHLLSLSCRAAFPTWAFLSAFLFPVSQSVEVLLIFLSFHPHIQLAITLFLCRLSLFVCN